MQTLSKIKRDAIEIWNAGVAAVDARSLVENFVHVDGETIKVGEQWWTLDELKRLIVIGFGKASGGMALGLEQALGDSLQSLEILSQVNVPDDQVVSTEHIRMDGCRPPGKNLPTPRVIEATERILELMSSATPSDLCICLISGGGSALLEKPVPPVSLEDLRTTTSFLSESGADIYELNSVRRKISMVKGGGLGAACQAPMVSLILSDVVGDPLDVIASGATANPTISVGAVEVLERYDPNRKMIPASVWSVVENDAAAKRESRSVLNLVIGNIELAMNAAATKAQELGYKVDSIGASGNEGPAEQVGNAVVGDVERMFESGKPGCMIRGGETTVELTPGAGQGGRNQHLVLSALSKFHEMAKKEGWPGEFCLLSGGTDGEDGATDIAGALIDQADVLRTAADQPAILDSLSRFDSHSYHENQGTLFQTGKTWTNVCDLRIVLTQPS